MNKISFSKFLNFENCNPKMPKIQQLLKKLGESGTEFVTTANFGSKNKIRDHKYSIVNSEESRM